MSLPPPTHHAHRRELTPPADLELYSQTKLVTAVAILQLVDRGIVSLDDPAVVEKHAPELLAQEVLSYEWVGGGRPAKGVLLTHHAQRRRQ